MMHAVVWKHRIDIFGAQALPKDKWDPLLNELKAEHVPSATPPGKRAAVVGGPGGQTDAFVYRTADMADEEVIRILDKYGITAKIGAEKVD